MLSKKLKKFLKLKGLSHIFNHNVLKYGRFPRKGPIYNVEKISQGFSWQDTPQGHTYWSLLSIEFDEYRRKKLDMMDFLEKMTSRLSGCIYVTDRKRKIYPIKLRGREQLRRDGDSEPIKCYYDRKNITHRKLVQRNRKGGILVC